MIVCKMNSKEYHVDFVSARALREMQPALEAYGQIETATRAALNGQPTPVNSLSISEATDRIVKWFCVLFGHQFTPDEIYDHYPSDRLIHDGLIALLAVQSGTTEALSDFPTKAAQAKSKA